MPPMTWPELPLNHQRFEQPPREYGILPFWFLNGELDPEEMRLQLREFRDKGMPGIILHARYGLEMPYLGTTYQERIKLAIEEAEKLGLETWIYDEMNWPSGTADGRVMREHPDLAQRYLECITFTVRGPWFSYLTGADSRYLDFECSTPVAAFAIGADGRVIDLTPNLSFVDVIPWEAPPGNWRLMYIVEKEADYYIDALNPDATAEFLRVGYAPYLEPIGDKAGSPMRGFYTDEPAMHYYLTGADNPIVPWTRDMFRRFQERNGYNLRPRLPDLFFDVSPESARVRYDFYTTLTEFYSDAYYRQIHEWCQAHSVLFTGHLLYEEWLRKMIRVEGNVFKHYAHMDVIGVDHLYPFIGNRDRPDEHVAMKVASSAAHQLGSQRLLCESFGGLFMDATMQRMKWVADWEYVLGVTILNPHGFHYTLEGPRKRDWPPSMFYQYPWWHYYGDFSAYMTRLSHLLTGGRHVAKVAVIWPINAMFATYTPQSHNALGDRIEGDFNALTDLLLRLHYDFDYLDEDILAQAEVGNSAITLRDEAYELLILPPMAHLKLTTLDRLEQFVAGGGRVLAMIFLPDHAFATDGLVDISDRIQTLFGVHPGATQSGFRQQQSIDVALHEHPGGGKTAFVQSYALARQLPLRLQRQLGTSGQTESSSFVIEPDGDHSRYWFAAPDGSRQEITDEVAAERQVVMALLQQTLDGLIEPDVRIDNPELFYLHRIKDERDLYFLVNPTFTEQRAVVTVTGNVEPVIWDPSTGSERPVVPTQVVAQTTRFEVVLPPVGSAFVLAAAATAVQHTGAGTGRIVASNITIDALVAGSCSGYGRVTDASIRVQQGDRELDLKAPAPPPADILTLDGEWEFVAEDENSLIIREALTSVAASGAHYEHYAALGSDTIGWLPMVPGAWSYQLPAEPSEPYPLDVWYRLVFEADYLPPSLKVIVDGFAGSGWKLFVNGQPVLATPVRSAFDSQMQAIEIRPLALQGRNVVALCLTVTTATDGLLDLLKIMGDFSLVQRAGTYVIAAPRVGLEPGSWTTQGYPFYSGRGVYRRSFCVPADWMEQRVFVEPALHDDVVEVIVNGRQAGVRLWAPYIVEITELLQPGDNQLELRVANTLVNLLEAVERPSGLGGPPQIVPQHRFSFAWRPELATAEHGQTEN